MAMQRGSAARVAEFGEGFGGGAGGLLGVDAGAGVDVGRSGRGGGGDVEGLVHGVGAFADADGEDGVDAGGVGRARTSCGRSEFRCRSRGGRGSR